MRLTLSKDLLTKVASLNNPLAGRLLGQLENSAVDFLDLKLEGTKLLLTFLDVKRSKDLEAGSTPFTSRFRQSSSIGKTVRKVLPTSTDDEIRTFTEQLQGTVVSETTKFYVMCGDNIRQVYQIPKDQTLGGDLASSCYQGIVHDDEFDFAILNPDVVKCLVGFENNKLAFRNLFILGQNAGNVPAVLSEGFHGAAKYYDKVVKYFKQFTQANSSFKAPINGGKFLHHVNVGYNPLQEEIVQGGYARPMSDKWFTGTSYFSIGQARLTNPYAIDHIVWPEPIELK